MGRPAHLRYSISDPSEFSIAFRVISWRFHNSKRNASLGIKTREIVLLVRGPVRPLRTGGLSFILIQLSLVSQGSHSYNED